MTCSVPQVLNPDPTFSQACREACGGQGFLAANKIGPLKSDMDVDVTFEGDNTVMMQQVRARGVRVNRALRSCVSALRRPPGGAMCTALH